MEKTPESYILKLFYDSSAVFFAAAQETNKVEFTT